MKQDAQAFCVFSVVWTGAICVLQEMFEQVNKAYEFLCSKSKVKDGPDPQNIVLILRAQSILFSRYKEGQHQLSLGTRFVVAAVVVVVVVVVFIAFI